MFPLLVGGVVIGAIVYLAKDQHQKAQVLNVQGTQQNAQTVDASQAQADQAQPTPPDQEVVVEQPDDTSGGSTFAVPRPTLVATAPAPQPEPQPSPGGPGAAPGSASDGSYTLSHFDVLTAYHGDASGLTDADVASTYSKMAGPTGLVF